MAGISVLRLVAWACLLTGCVVCVSTFSHGSKKAGSAVCIPGVSIRCEPEDCGRYYVKCGKHETRQEVPSDRVCYQGALVPLNSKLRSSRLLPLNCPTSTSQSKNSTQRFDLKACNCPLHCSGTDVCVCYCKTGAASACTCTNNGRTYVNPQQAVCCLPNCKIKKSETGCRDYNMVFRAVGAVQSTVCCGRVAGCDQC